MPQPTTCEDYPACGHEPGCCPDYDPVTGAQLNMKCVCGATVPITSRSSLCAACLAPEPACSDYDPPVDDYTGGIY